TPQITTSPSPSKAVNPFQQATNVKRHSPVQPEQPTSPTLEYPPSVQANLDRIHSTKVKFNSRCTKFCSSHKTSLRFPSNSTYATKITLIVAWFSANAFIGTITPVKNGGIPHFAELKLVFNEGGAFEFYN